MSRKKPTSKTKSKSSVKNATSSHSSKRPSSNHNKVALKKSVNWSKLAERLFYAAVLIGIVTYSVAAYVDKMEIEQDLSVIGNGTATVVQIHDPSCRLCQQLKRNLDSVKGDFKDSIQFKIAAIYSKKGREFASKHRVQHVTLLFFDPQGRRVETMQGVTPAEDIRQELSRLASRQRP